MTTDKKINNPFVDVPGYKCFGCSPDNNFGLQMTFSEIEDKIVSYWHPANHFEGWHNILHGGIQAALMDEIASWVIFVKLGSSGVTRSMSVKYKKPVLVDKGIVTLEAKLINYKHQLADIEVKLISDNEVKAEAEIRYLVHDENTAKNVFKFPNKDKF